MSFTEVVAIRETRLGRQYQGGNQDLNLAMPTLKFILDLNVDMSSTKLN